MNLIEIILYWGKLYLPNAISNSDTLEFSNILFIVKHPSYKWAALCRRDKAYDSVRPFTHCILKSDPWKNPLLGQCIHDKINYTKLWLRRLFCGFFHEWNERNLTKSILFLRFISSFQVSYLRVLSLLDLESGIFKKRSGNRMFRWSQFTPTPGKYA